MAAAAEDRARGVSQRIGAGAHNAVDLPPICLTCRLRDVHDDAKDKPFELELSWLSEATGWRHVPVPADRIAAADAWAQAQIEAEDMGDD